MRADMKKRKPSSRPKNHFLYVGAVITAVMLLLIISGYFKTPYSPTAMNAAEKMKGLSLHHLMGTDNMGRDIFSRVLTGGGTTLLISVCVVAIGCICGTVIGALTGYFGGWPDEILMRICDCITAFPSILLALVIVAVTGGGKYNVIWALGILFIPSFARVVRGEFARYRTQNFVVRAHLTGAGHLRIMFIHILPNTIPVLLPAITIGFNNAVLAESSMSYLGIGGSPPDISLGRMLQESQTYLKSAPWYAISVGLTIVFLILGFSLLGEGLQQRRHGK